MYLEPGLKDWPGFAPDSSFKDSFSASVTFMNSGSTPVSIISSQFYISGDSADMEDEIMGFRNPSGLNWKDSLWRFERVDSCFYLDNKAVSTVDFSCSLTHFSEEDFREFVLNSTTYSWMDESDALLHVGLWLLMANPYGEYSIKLVPLGSPFYNRNSAMSKGASVIAFEQETMPTFRDLNHWEALKDK